MQYRVRKQWFIDFSYFVQKQEIIEVFPEQSPLYMASNLTVPRDVGPVSVERIDEATAIVVG